MSGQFREHLYDRLNVFEIEIPALRERPDDIEPLIGSMLARATVHGKLALAIAALQSLPICSILPADRALQ